MRDIVKDSEGVEKHIFQKLFKNVQMRGAQGPRRGAYIVNT
jgi:hypothetical protein